METREARAANLLTNIACILDVVKQEWGEAWSQWDQEQRDGITAWLKEFYDAGQAGRAVTEPKVTVGVPQPTTLPDALEEIKRAYAYIAQLQAEKLAEQEK